MATHGACCHGAEGPPGTGPLQTAALQRGVVGAPCALRKRLTDRPAAHVASRHRRRADEAGDRAGLHERVAGGGAMGGGGGEYAVVALFGHQL